VGSYFAGGAHHHLDGSYGAPAPRPTSPRRTSPCDRIRHPARAPLPGSGRDSRGVTLIASGGLRSAWDIAKAIALGADAW